jgi:hypothetical protein
MREREPPFFAFQLQSLIFNELALSGFFENCNHIVSLVLENGSAVTLTDSMLRRRQQLGLPEISRSDNAEISKLARAIGRRKTVKEES